MRVLQIGNFGAPFSTENDLKKSLESIAVEVATVQENAWDGGLSVLDAAPDWVLYTHTHGWGPEAAKISAFLEECRLRDIPTVAYHLDLWRGLEREKDLDTHPFFRCRYMFSPDPGPPGWWTARGVNHVWHPPAVLEASCYLAEPDPGAHPHRVIFVGSRGYHHEYAFRPSLIRFLAETYGQDFALYEHASGMRGHKLNVLYASAAVAVGDSCFGGQASHPGYTSDRFYESLGRGARVVTPAIAGITEGAPCRTFAAGNLVSLRAAVAEALAVPAAEALAERHRAVEWVRESHTYRHRLEAVIARLAADRQPVEIAPPPVVMDIPAAVTLPTPPAIVYEPAEPRGLPVILAPSPSPSPPVAMPSPLLMTMPTSPPSTPALALAPLLRPEERWTPTIDSTAPVAWTTGRGHCSDCVFWTSALCRRYPPSRNGAWPQTRATDWCGEWQAKGAAA